ncbi:PaaI family thioesterase [Piscinibacter gummiphilus]|uniref:Phenylacetic acid degradation protein n=1 Tax=Piscinibacter gummiphilus TaxID=946333 RepID=A0A1W6LIJ7_9BURK|nr:PaaI family thioesterase [Piscinibacter gummiphilus]ARN24104.1 phenylacetic acid degradation protein [Piscinibacter gummiphilus]ATU68783.1 PaaI family thioesterase [Piscinibacter gummiphilus]GLS97540.1 putative phenylacetic acid degradation-related protein [Piscinibacter gummiphilus]
MLRPEVTPETLMSRQAGTLPGQFDLRVTSVTEGRLTAEMLVQPWMLAPNGFLHAASVIVLADSCAGYATIAHLPAGARSFTTIELKSNFFGTARQGLLHCEATAEHTGRSTQVWSSTVTGPDGKKIALFRCTQMVLV